MNVDNHIKHPLRGSPIITRNTQREQIYAQRVHSETTNLRKRHGWLPKFNGTLLVPYPVFPENFIEIHL